MIEWSKIRNISDVLDLPKHYLYDDAEGKDANAIKLNPDLDDEERKSAEWWRQFVWGLMLINGDYGGGKGILLHFISKLMSYYFGKLPVMDTRPTQAFGTYVPFSADLLEEDVKRMEEVSTGIPRPFQYKGFEKYDFDDVEDWRDYRALSPEEQFNILVARGRITDKVEFQDWYKPRNLFTATTDFKPHVDKDTGKWISSRGEVFLHHCTLGLDEYGGKYVPRKSPNLAIAQALGSQHNFLRHLQCLVLGVGATVDDFNYNVLSKATWQAICEKLDNHRYSYSDNEDDLVFRVKIYKVEWNDLRKQLVRAELLANFVLNGSEPRKMCGGYAIKDIYITDNAQGFNIPKVMRKGV